MEIPCPTCATWSYFIQNKLKISIYLSLDKCKICIKLINFIFHILINYYEFTCCIENSVDPDQLTPEEARLSGSTLFTRELISAWFHTVLESANCFSTERCKLICTIRQVKFLLDKYIMAIYLSLDK